MADNLAIRIYVNKKRITFKIKTGYYLELIMPETVELLGSTKSKIIKNENSENLPHSEITGVVLVHCNIVNSDVQYNSRVLYTFVPNKSLVQLLDIPSKKFLFLKTLNSEFSYIEVWLTDQNSQLLGIENTY